MKLYTLEWWAYLTKDSQYQGLDLMRSIAILMVVIWHFDSFVFRIGWIGVDLFFILSGFLIGSILLKSVESKAFSYRLYI